jgi:hypothetical protein
MADHWEYRIEAYRRIPGEFGWSPAKDGTAELWLLLGEQGDDHRCFGGFSSRADADRALDDVRHREKEPRHAADDQGYHARYGRDGTEDEIRIHAPDGRPLAYIWYWEAEYDQPGAGDKEAHADAQLILDALNAYQAGPTPSEAAHARPGTKDAYHASPARDPFDHEDAIDIRAPDGRSMAFLWLADHPDQAHADAQLIVAALNTYQPQQAPSKEAAAANADLSDAFLKILDRKQPALGEAGQAGESKFAEQLRQAQPTTRHLIHSLLLDTWPNLGTCADFGIHSQQQYEALYYPVRAQELTPDALDAALRDGPRLTALTRAAPSNPHKDVTFYTGWDLLLGRQPPVHDVTDAGLSDAFQQILDRKPPAAGDAGPAPEATSKDRDRGIER